MIKKTNLLAWGFAFAISLLAFADAEAAHRYTGNKLIVVNNNSSAIDTLKRDSVYTKVDKQPSFQGGQKIFDLYVAKNMQYPKAMLDKEIEGRVILQFIVEPDGTLTDIKALKGPGRGSAEEAVRIMKTSPKWMPGIKDGKAVRVLVKTPIIFTIKPDENFRESSAPMKISNGG